LTQGGHFPPQLGTTVRVQPHPPAKKIVAGAWIIEGINYEALGLASLKTFDRPDLKKPSTAEYFWR